MFLGSAYMTEWEIEPDYRFGTDLPPNRPVLGDLPSIERISVARRPFPSKFRVETRCGGPLALNNACTATTPCKVGKLCEVPVSLTHSEPLAHSRFEEEK